MSFYADDSTIIALSTPAGVNSAIAVIRVSGNFKLEDFSSLFSINLSRVEPRRAFFTKIIDPQFKDIVDEVLITFFSADASYNGENILEISCHGNSIIINQIINLFLHNFSIRRAKPGEFTYRAYLNQKLSLTQIEGLDLLLNATSPHTLDSARSLFSGEIHKDFILLQELLLKFKAAVDMNLDFLEDIGDQQAIKIFNESLEKLFQHTSKLYGRTQSTTASLLNPSVVLFGNTNAGKSTFFNYLLGTNRAIVSDIDGTTRDYISDTVTIDGTHFRLIDTAGMRSTNDKIEMAGIELAKDLLDGAFFKIKLISSNNFSVDQLSNNFDLFIITHADRMIDEIDSSREDVVVADLVGPIGPEKIGDKSGPMGPVIFGPIGPKSEKDINGPIGPDFLRNFIFKKIKDSYDKAFLNNPILIERQRNLIKELHNLLSENFDLLKSESDFAIIDFYVNKISLLCEELIGIITPDELLTSIFSNFCIGK